MRRPACPWTRSIPGAGWRPPSSGPTSETGTAPWRRCAGAWSWCPGTMSSPLSAGRSRRAGLWRRWSSTGSTRSATAVLQAGGDENEAEKRLSIAGILLRSGEPRCHQGRPLPHGVGGGRPLLHLPAALSGAAASPGRFFLNEAALSKFPLSWVRELVRRLPELDRRGRTFLAAQAGLGTEGLSLEWFAVHPDRTMRLCLHPGAGPADGPVRAGISPFAARTGSPPWTRPEGGAFLAFVLLEAPAWDPDQFRRDLRDLYGHPLPHRGGGGSRTAAAP